MDTSMAQEQDIIRRERIQPEVTHPELIPPEPRALIHPLHHTCRLVSAPVGSTPQDSTLHQPEHIPLQAFTLQRLIQLVHLLEQDILPVQVTLPVCGLYSY